MPITSAHFGGSTAVQDNTHLTVPPDDKFVLFTHSKSASVRTVDGVARLLPELGVKRMSPGVGVRTRSATESEHQVFADAVNSFESTSGASVIPTNMPIPGRFCFDGQDRNSYIVEYDARDPVSGKVGKCYRTPWAEPVHEPGEPTQWVYHHDKRDAWVAWLVDEKSSEVALRVPSARTKAAIIGRATSRVDRMRNIPEPTIREDAVKARTADLEKVQAAVAFDATKATSKPRRSRANA